MLAIAGNRDNKKGTENMATYDVHDESATGNDRVDSIVWTLGANPGRNSNVFQVTDGQSDNVWAVGDSVTLRLHKIGGGVLELAGHYRGTVTINGKVYPVVETTTSSWFALGAGDDVDNAPALIANALDTSGTFTVCFFPGTLIATPLGERNVEDLVPGEPVLIGDPSSVPATWTGRMARALRRRLGFRRAVPVKWLGRQTVSTRFGPAERLMPVRFAAGSLGGGGATSSPA